MSALTDQRLSALEQANRIRTARAQLKRDIAAGRVAFASLLAHPPDWLLSARVWDLAMAIPRAGRSKLHQAFLLASCSPARTFADITPHQRDRLLGSLRSWPSLRDRIGQAA